MRIELTKKEWVAFNQAMGNALYEWQATSWDLDKDAATRDICADLVEPLKSAWRKIDAHIDRKE